MNTIETAWQIYATVNEWIRFSDTKAGAILAADGVIAAVAFSLLPEPVPAAYLPLIVSGAVSGVLSVYFSILCLNPALRFGEPNSLIFFAHIAQRYQGPNEYAEALVGVFSEEEAAAAQIAAQIWVNSRVALKKYRAVTWATRSFGFTVAVIVLGVMASWL